MPYFSVEEGEFVTDCHDGLSVLCDTAACELTSSFTSRGVCIDAPTVDGSFPVKCESDGDCIG
jgi:hypothetical protein